MSKMFLRRMRITTLVWAFVIAFYYQLSTPQLFHDFSTDPELQAQAEATGRQVLAGTAETPAESDDASYFQLDPWSAGMAFYYQPVNASGEALDCGGADASAKGCDFKLRYIQVSNLIGVLITVMLLSLGAPFWFDMLKQVVNLKDTLAKETETKSGAGDAVSEPAEKSGIDDDRVAVLEDRMAASKNPVVQASLQKEINDLRLARAQRLSAP